MKIIFYRFLIFGMFLLNFQISVISQINNSYWLKIKDSQICEILDKTIAENYPSKYKIIFAIYIHKYSKNEYRITIVEEDIDIMCCYDTAVLKKLKGAFIYNEFTFIVIDEGETVFFEKTKKRYYIPSYIKDPNKKNIYEEIPPPPILYHPPQYIYYFKNGKFQKQSNIIQ